jgi:DNA repair protein RadA/Sms
MAASLRAAWQCTECQALWPKWAGKCETCGAWNSIHAIAQGSGPEGGGKEVGQVLPMVQTCSPEGAGGASPERLVCGMDAFDHTMGGGLVPGSFVLLGGDPGVGKSTLLSQVLARLSPRHGSCYVSAEEDVEQVRLRARRLGLGDSPLYLLAASTLEDILATLTTLENLKVVVIDSVQTISSVHVDSAPGTLVQVRACAHALMHFARQNQVCVIIVSHVTKEGVIAGPRTLEHMVDAVVYFEGERNQSCRILRAIKNRFGATDETGVFVMEENGLAPVANPSALFLNQRAHAVPGTVVYAGLEGTRPLLVEIQALVAPAASMPPRRHVVGWDANRLGMMMAILETHGGLPLGQKDVYLNVVGGVRLADPGVDLAVCSAIVSCLLGTPLPDQAVFFGETGLVGEMRPVGHTGARLKEAVRMGFSMAFMPPGAEGAAPAGPPGLVVCPVPSVRALLDKVRAHGGVHR